MHMGLSSDTDDKSLACRFPQWRLWERPAFRLCGSHCLTCAEEYFQLSFCLSFSLSALSGPPEPAQHTSSHSLPICLALCGFTAAFHPDFCFLPSPQFCFSSLLILNPTQLKFYLLLEIFPDDLSLKWWLPHLHTHGGPCVSLIWH